MAILGVLRSAIRQVGARLMDAVDPRLLDRVQASVEAVPGVLGVGSLQLRWIGHTLHAEVDITVPAELTLGQGHELSHTVEAAMISAVPRMTGATVHTSPREQPLTRASSRV